MTDAASNDDSPLPTSPDDLLALLDALEIKYQLKHHKAVFSVAESEALDRELPGVPCRNFFLRDHKKKMYLVVLPNAVKVDLKKLATVIGSGRLSFGSPQRLWDNLGVRPGSVCPFSIINDTEKNVQLILDQSMMAADLVGYHPLLNTMTVSLKPSDLSRFIDHCGHSAKIFDLQAAAPDPA